MKLRKLDSVFGGNSPYGGARERGYERKMKVSGPRMWLSQAKEDL
jgi:hypothetical protein